MTDSRPTDLCLQKTQYHSFLLVSNIVYTYHIFSIHLSIDRHLGCFHVLAILNIEAMSLIIREKADEDYNKVSPHTSQYGHHQKIYKQ